MVGGIDGSPQDRLLAARAASLLGVHRRRGRDRESIIPWRRWRCWRSFGIDRVHQGTSSQPDARQAYPRTPRSASPSSAEALAPALPTLRPHRNGWSAAHSARAWEADHRRGGCARVRPKVRAGRGDPGALLAVAAAEIARVSACDRRRLRALPTLRAAAQRYSLGFDGCCGRDRRRDGRCRRSRRCSFLRRRGDNRRTSVQRSSFIAGIGSRARAGSRSSRRSRPPPRALAGSLVAAGDRSRAAGCSRVATERLPLRVLRHRGARPSRLRRGRRACRR